MATQSFSDQMGHTIYLDRLPQRIISLVPSQTELLADLGLSENVVGITKFCIHPSRWRSQKTIVGGTKNFHFNIIDDLKPDLIIGNKEENYLEGIETLRKKYPVWMSDIISLQDALRMIESVGLITGKKIEAHQWAQDFAGKLSSLKKFCGQSVLYLIWREPWMAAGKNTFIDSMLSATGLENIFEAKERYPDLTAAEIKSLAPNYIFLSSEPYPFGEKHIHEIKAISPTSKILLVDGEMFSWYGSRLSKAIDYFTTLALD